MKVTDFPRKCFKQKLLGFEIKVNYLFIRMIGKGRGRARGSTLIHIPGTWLIIKLSFSALFLYAFVSAMIHDICIIRNITFHIFAAWRRTDGDFKYRGTDTCARMRYLIIYEHYYHMDLLLISSFILGSS